MTRERLTNRRASETFSFECGGLRFTATVSRSGDGRLGEFFVENRKASSFAGIMASDAAIAASLALQFGCPAEMLRKALSRDSRGRASSPLGATLNLLAEEGT
jgi:hypothetical protein